MLQGYNNNVMLLAIALLDLEEDFKIYCFKKHNTCNWQCQNKIWCCCRNGEEGDNKVLPRHMNHDYHGVDYDKDNQEEEGL